MNSKAVVSAAFTTIAIAEGAYSVAEKSVDLYGSKKARKQMKKLKKAFRIW